MNEGQVVVKLVNWSTLVQGASVGRAGANKFQEKTSVKLGCVRHEKTSGREKSLESDSEKAGTLSI